jgi:GNAT superfamily N-acetyltransferase
VPFGNDPVAPLLRPGRDDDAAGFIALISGCWAEYPGCVFDLDGEVPELRALATHFSGKGGALWVAEFSGVVVGMTATWPLDQETWEIGKMYVARGHRGGGVARDLIMAAEAHAVARGALRVKLWTDTRFDRAHRFYEKHSFVRSGPIRSLGDKSNSIEFGYMKPIDAVARLDAAGAASAVVRLATILRECVNNGASVSFLPPLTAEVSLAFFNRVAREVAAGNKILLAAWIEGVLAGTVQVDLNTPANQPHRAEIQKMLVLPQARRRGVARALMARAEAEARDSGRTLLTLDTREGDAAEPLYRSMGFAEAGRIPGYALNPDGTKHATVIFYKTLAG